MITKIIQIDGSDHAIMPNGDVRKLVRHRISSTDVIANSDGTFSIPAIVDAKDSDTAYTRDTVEIYMYDEEKQVWWKQ